MPLDEGTYEPALLKGHILHYCQGLVKVLKENEKLVTDSFHSELLGDKDLTKDLGLQPGDVVYWKRLLERTIPATLNKSLWGKT